MRLVKTQLIKKCLNIQVTSDTEDVEVELDEEEPEDEEPLCP